METERNFADAKPVDGKIPNFEKFSYQGLASPDRSIRSFVASFSDFVVVTNSLDQLTRIAQVFEGKSDSLSSLEEYRFFRQRYPIVEKKGKTLF